MKNVLHIVVFLLIAPLLFFGVVGITLAQSSGSNSEINYGHVVEQKGNHLLIEYRSPSDDTRVLCTTDGSCTPTADNKSLYPTIPNTFGYEKSPGGKYGVSQLTLVGTGKAIYSLYDISGDTPKLKTIIPFNNLVQSIRFSPNDSAVLFFGFDGSVATYNITNGSLSNTTITQTDLPFLSISPDGSYLAAYNYVAEAHRIWNLKTGTMRELPSKKPSYVAFDESTNTAYYLARHGAGFDAIYSLHLANLTTNTPQQLFANEMVVADTLALDGSLYFISNHGSPLDWTLSKLNPSTKEVTTITDASYGEYMRIVNGMVAFVQIEGKNADVALYNPQTSQVVVLDALGSSPSESGITRDAVVIEGLHGALLKPTSQSPSTGFIWLHGGPERQTSVGYHPYLSYAVYDELLEKIAVSGSYVLKIDYAGSYGYGTTFTENLVAGVGKRDVNDVVAGIEYLMNEKGVEDVYLIGNSYGGYLALKTLVDHTDKVEGAVSINGVTDWNSLVSRIPSSPFKKYFGGIPGPTTISSYLDASIVTRTQEIGDEKILIAYGENDTTVPPRQSREFASLAQLFDKDVTLVSYPNEEHVIRERATLNDLCTQISATLGVTLQCE